MVAARGRRWSGDRKPSMKYLAILGIFAAALRAQPPASEQEDQKTRITLDVTRVQLLFTVSDKKGRFVSDLAKEDFQVFEAKKPQSIVEFTAESDLPLRLAILIDTSNSIRDRFKFQQEAATDFVNTVIRPAEDRAAIVSFDAAPELVADLTGDVEKLTSAIRSLRAGGGRRCTTRFFSPAATS